MKPNERDPSESELQLCRHILNLQSRIDALTTVVETLALRHGSTPEKFHSSLQTMIDAIYQKRLERIEGQSPRLAALLIQGMELPEVDQKYLDWLRFDDQKD